MTIYGEQPQPVTPARVLDAVEALVEAVRDETRPKAVREVPVAPAGYTLTPLYPMAPNGPSATRAARDRVTQLVLDLAAAADAQKREAGEQRSQARKFADLREEWAARARKAEDELTALKGFVATLAEVIAAGGVLQGDERALVEESQPHLWRALARNAGIGGADLSLAAKAGRMRITVVVEPATVTRSPEAAAVVDAHKFADIFFNTKQADGGASA